MLFTDPAQLPSEAQALLKTAVRQQTPCGVGMMTWHIWGQKTHRQALVPVVLFHGGSGSWTHWLRNIEALVESGRQVYVPDLPGFGDSDRPDSGNDADALPDPVEQGLSLLLGSVACDFVGFSFGGMVAGFIAERFPQRVRRLVLVGAPGLGVKPQNAYRLQPWRHLEDADQRDVIHRNNLATLMLYRPDNSGDLALRLHVINLVRDRLQERCLSRTDVLAHALTRVSCPVYAIYGREDALFKGSLEALGLALHQATNFKGLTLLEETGHWVQFEEAGGFNAALLTCLDSAL